MSCTRLTSLQSLSAGELMDRATSIFKGDESLLNFRLNVIFKDRDTNIGVRNELANLIYYREGHLDSLREEWNKLTRLQLEHELQVLGDWHNEVDALSSTFRLRVRLVGAVRQAWEDAQLATQPKEECLEAAAALPLPYGGTTTKLSSYSGSSSSFSSTNTPETTPPRPPRPPPLPSTDPANVEGDGFDEDEKNIYVTVLGTMLRC